METNEFPKISVKMIISKLFTSPKQRAASGNLFSLPPRESYLYLLNKYFLTEVYMNIQTFDFQVLQECSPLASRNGAMQMFFSETNEKHVFCCVAGVYFL